MQVELIYLQILHFPNSPWARLDPTWIFQRWLELCSGSLQRVFWSPQRLWHLPIVPVGFRMATECKAMQRRWPFYHYKGLWGPEKLQEGVMLPKLQISVPTEVWEQIPCWIMRHHLYFFVVCTVAVQLYIMMMLCKAKTGWSFWSPNMWVNTFCQSFSPVFSKNLFPCKHLLREIFPLTQFFPAGFLINGFK